jgi:hypothetical protein
MESGRSIESAFLSYREDRGRLDSNPRSRCGSRLSDYADGMARRAGGQREGKGRPNTAVDVSMIARFTVERSD